MSQSPVTEEQAQSALRFWGLVGAAAAALAAAYLATSGGGDGAISRITSAGVEIRIGTGGKATDFTRDLREALLDVIREVRREIEILLRSDPSPVPIDTGLLRESLVVEPSPTFDAIVLRWPVQYAKHLWERGYIPGRHPGTVQRWDRATILLVKPVIVQAFRRVLTERGWTVL